MQDMFSKYLNIGDIVLTTLAGNEIIKAKIIGYKNIIDNHIILELETNSGTKFNKYSQLCVKYEK